MAVFDLLKSPGGRGFLMGVTAGLLAPVVVRAAEPVVRVALKAGLLAYEKGRETVAELTETVDDVVAEVKADFTKKYNAELAKAEMAAAGEVADESKAAQRSKEEVPHPKVRSVKDLKKTA